MTHPLEYHNVVNRSSIPASLVALLLPLLVSTSLAQIGGASAGSAHSGGAAAPTAMNVAPPTAIGVAPPTGVSVGHGGFTASGSGFSHTTNSSHFPNGTHGNGNGHRPHHTANGTAYYPYVYALPVPYAVDVSAAADNDNNDEDDADYQGGPTIFDRRGSGPDSYIPPSSDGPAHDSTESAATADADEPPQSPTTLVFKDGHQIEVNNYAIVSQILYDLTPGHPRKIALADLDLLATQKQNDDHGVVFQLPPTSQAN
jgi:hypothetical protein